VPADIVSVLKVQIGASINKGDLLAESKSFFGLFKSGVESPINGTLENASPITGQLILREAPIPVQVLAYIDGRITEIFENEGIRVKASGAFIQGIFGVGGERYGPLKTVVESPDEILDVDKIHVGLKGCVVIGGARVTLEAYKKASKVGAVAVISGGLLNIELKQLLGYEQGVAITGHEDLSTTLILTEGFGDISMARGTFDLFKANEGRNASVSGATQIRAGVIRPEVIIPSDDVEKIVESKRESGGLEVGHVLRVIRAPYFGKIGTVTALPPELEKLETGAKVRVFELKLTNDERIDLPRANVEIIEN
nr:hypothetical protein [bacterium]